jgi:hypothetical protein
MVPASISGERMKVTRIGEDQMRRPQFAQAWSLFQIIHGNGTLTTVGNQIGGKVKANIDAKIFTNACALRMSYVLNRAGLPIPHLVHETVSGGDGYQYFFRVKDLFEFLRNSLGKPDSILTGPSAGGLTAKKGLLVFEVAIWRDASGHATLWDGVTCSDHCYFPVAKRVLFWALP